MVFDGASRTFCGAAGVAPRPTGLEEYAAGGSGAEGEMKRAILSALAGEMRFFLLPDGKIPEWVELRVCYENTISTLRVGKGEILKAGERRNEAN